MLSILQGHRTNNSNSAIRVLEFKTFLLISSLTFSTVATGDSLDLKSGIMGTAIGTCLGITSAITANGVVGPLSKAKLDFYDSYFESTLRKSFTQNIYYKEFGLSASEETEFINLNQQLFRTYINAEGSKSDRADRVLKKCRALYANELKLNVYPVNVCSTYFTAHIQAAKARSQRKTQKDYVTEVSSELLSQLSKPLQEAKNYNANWEAALLAYRDIGQNVYQAARDNVRKVAIDSYERCARHLVDKK